MSKRRNVPDAVAFVFAALLAATAARADEGGVSFWAPGRFSSLAAVPGEPGWSLPVVWRNWKFVFYDEERDWWSPPTKLSAFRRHST